MIAFMGLTTCARCNGTCNCTTITLIYLDSWPRENPLAMPKDAEDRNAEREEKRRDHLDRIRRGHRPGW